MRTLALLIALLAAAAATPPVEAGSDYYPDIIVVPDDFPTLAAALAAATDHDTIILRDYVANETGLVINGLVDLSILVQGNTSIGLIGPGPLLTIRSSSSIRIWGLPVHTYGGNSGPLILVVNSSGVVFENMRILDSGGNATIMAVSSSGVAASYVEASGSGVFMYARDSARVSVTHSALHGYREAVVLRGVAGAELRGNVIAGAGVAVDARSSSNMFIEENTLAETSLVLNATECSAIYVRSNTLRGQGRLAYMRGVDATEIAGGGASYVCRGTCIHVENSSRIQVDGLAISNASTGILLSGVSGASASHIEVSGAQRGIVLNSTVNASLTDSVFTGNNVSIYIERSWGATISGVTVRLSGIGVYFHETYTGFFSIIEGEARPSYMKEAVGGKGVAADFAGRLLLSHIFIDYSRPAMHNITIERCRRGVVVKNTGERGVLIGGINFTGNDVAVEIREGAVSLTLNYFSGNTVNVLSRVGTVNATPRVMLRYLYTGEPVPVNELGVLGNYWEGHVGVDWDGDGVLDVPYKDRWVLDDAPLAAPPNKYRVYSAYMPRPATIYAEPSYRAAVFPDAPAAVYVPFAIYNPFLTPATYAVRASVMRGGEPVEGAVLLTGTQASYPPLAENSVRLPGYMYYEGVMVLILPPAMRTGNTTYTISLAVVRGEAAVASTLFNISVVYIGRFRRPEAIYMGVLPPSTPIQHLGDWAGVLASIREFPLIAYEQASHGGIGGRTVAAAPGALPETRVELSVVAAAVLATIIILSIHAAEAEEARRTLYQYLEGRETRRGGA